MDTITIRVAATAAHAYADTLAEVAACADSFDVPCTCPAHDDPGQAQEAHDGAAYQAVEAAYLALGRYGDISWELPETGCYWAHAARLWRDRARSLEKEAAPRWIGAYWVCTRPLDTGTEAAVAEELLRLSTARGRHESLAVHGNLWGGADVVVALPRRHANRLEIVPIPEGYPNLHQACEVRSAND